ncbi:MAG: hypothetical protein ACU85V_06665 [Gammaproteobacteria bacterium]
MRSLPAVIAALALLVTLLPGALPADESPAAAPDPAPPQYYVEDIKEAMTAHLAAEVDADGVFHLQDDRTGEMLALEFVKIHDPVRQIDGNTYFACTDFRLRDAPKKLYDIDFWLHPVDGALEVYDTKVHKEPRWSLLYGWYKYPRYTFVNDRVVSLY